MRPADERVIERLEHSLALTAIKPAIVVHPAPYRRIRETRDLAQRLLAAGGQTPLSDLLPNARGDLSTHRRKEAKKNRPVAVARWPCPEGVAEKVERHVHILLSPSPIFAVDDARLRGMKLEPADCQPLAHGRSH